MPQIRCSSRKGMAIVVALFFAFCLMIMFFGLFTQHRNVTAHNRVSLQNQQAFFAARAAIQHLLLKAKLFPTEFYDAVEFSQGKNPLFDFSEYPRNDDSGKPIFVPSKLSNGVFVKDPVYREQDLDNNAKYFYIQLDGRPDVFVRIGSFYNPDFRYLAPSLASSNAAKRYTTPEPPNTQWNAGKYLKYYILDCTNWDDKHPSLDMKLADYVKTSRDWRLSDPGVKGYPYTMKYKVDEVSIHAMKELRRYNEEAIEIKVEGSIDDFQGKNYTQIQKKIQKITRSGKPVS